MTTEAFQQYVRLVDSPENQALPEAERLPMVAGWKHKACGTWERPVFIHTEPDLEYKHWYSVYADQPDPIDLQAASGVLAEWLGERGAVSAWKTLEGWAVLFQDCPDEFDGPTLLAAQVAAAGAVLGVK